MKRHLFLQVIAGSIALCSLLPVVADEPQSAALMQTLPPDGAWVTFDVNVKVNEQEFLMTATARSVGQALDGGKQCRFIEYEQSVDAPPALNNPQLGNLTWRLLVPEEEFGEGKDPLNMTHRIFRHRDVPFGIAGLQQDLKASLGGQEEKITIRVALRDYGKDAKPKLPDLLP